MSTTTALLADWTLELYPKKRIPQSGQSYLSAERGKCVVHFASGYKSIFKEIDKRSVMHYLRTLTSEVLLHRYRFLEEFQMKLRPTNLQLSTYTNYLPSKFIHKHWLHLTKNVPNKTEHRLHLAFSQYWFFFCRWPQILLETYLLRWAPYCNNGERVGANALYSVWSFWFLEEQNVPCPCFFGYFVKFIHVRSAVFLEYQCDQSRSEMLLWCCCCMFVVCP